MKERIKDVMLNYRYWMDMDGFDGMCFWSENHALMFYTCAMNAGDMMGCWMGTFRPNKRMR